MFSTSTSQVVSLAVLRKIGEWLLGSIGDTERRGPFGMWRHRCQCATPPASVHPSHEPMPRMLMSRILRHMESTSAGNPTLKASGPWALRARTGPAAKPPTEKQLESALPTRMSVSPSICSTRRSFVFKRKTSTAKDPRYVFPRTGATAVLPVRSGLCVPSPEGSTKPQNRKRQMPELQDEQIGGGAFLSVLPSQDHEKSGLIMV